MIGVVVKNTIQHSLKQLKRQQKKQKFALAVALTKTAKDAQKGVINHTKQKFKIKKRWVEKGKYAVRVRPAKVTKLQASVWNDAPWMTDHETGGVRTPDGNYFAVPTDQVKRTARGLISKANKPRSLKRSFVVQTDDGHSIIIKRTGKRGEKIMYNLVKKAKIKPQWKFVKIGKKIAQKRFDTNLRKSLRKYANQR